MGESSYTIRMTSNSPSLRLDTDLEALERAARVFTKASMSKNTLRSYAADWADFEFWCKRVKRKSLPATPDTVGLYLTHMSRHLKTSSLKRRVTAIGKAHELSRLSIPTKDPAVKAILKGILRSKGESQKHASPTLLKHISRMIEVMPEGSKGTRDKALILLGFAGGFRRSELIGLNIQDLSIGDEGLIIRITRSKTDQTGRGRTIGIPFGQNSDTCPVLALEWWLTTSRITEGPLFRPINQWGHIAETRLTDQSVRYILRESLLRAGIRPSGFSGHSLRAGFATVAAMNGATEHEIQRTTGHVSLEVLRRYIRDGELFKKNAARRLGL